MKVKKIALSLVAVAGLMSVGANAGEIDLNTTTSFAKELTVGQTRNLATGDFNLSYIYQGVTIQGGNVVLNFEGGKILDGNLTDSYLYYKSNDTSGDVNITFNSLTNNGKTATYKMESNATIPTGAELVWVGKGKKLGNGIDLNVTLDSGSTSFKVSIDVANSAGDIKDSAPATTILNGVQELSAKVLTSFSAQIDPVANYLKFTNSQSSNKGVVTLHRGITNKSVGNADTTVTLYSDTNLNDFGSLIPTATGIATNTSLACTSLTQNGQEYKMDCNLTWSSGRDSNITFNFTADGSHKIQETNFWVAAKVDSTAKNPNYSATILEKTEFGNWKNYGYRAQIPNVLATSNFKTYLKFTNASSLDADVYMTIRDIDGTVVTLSSADSEIASLPAGKTVKYLANTFLQTAYDKDNDLDIKQSVSVELNIPTNPNKVYGFASLKNISLGQFKDLPVYSTSSMRY